MVKAIPSFQEEKTDRPITWLAWGFGEWKWTGKGGGRGAGQNSLDLLDGIGLLIKGRINLRA